MKFFSTIVLALTATTGVSALSNEQICQRDKPGLAAAIRSFCDGIGSLDVPSNYASTGARSPKNYRAWTVSISANCRPVQWVPKKYCYSQFFDMCPAAKYNGGQIIRKFGRNNCQSWSIWSAYIYRRDEDAAAGNNNPVLDKE